LACPSSPLPLYAPAQASSPNVIPTSSPLAPLSSSLAASPEVRRPSPPARRSKGVLPSATICCAAVTGVPVSSVAEGRESPSSGVTGADQLTFDCPLDDDALQQSKEGWDYLSQVQGDSGSLVCPLSRGLGQTVGLLRAVVQEMPADSESKFRSFLQHLDDLPPLFRSALGRMRVLDESCLGKWFEAEKLQEEMHAVTVRVAAASSRSVPQARRMKSEETSPVSSSAKEPSILELQTWLPEDIEKLEKLEALKRECEALVEEKISITGALYDSIDKTIRDLDGRLQMIDGHGASNPKFPGRHKKKLKRHSGIL